MLGRKYVRLGREGRGGEDKCGSASVKGVRWSSMQAFLCSCSVTRVTVDCFYSFVFPFNPIINYSRQL